LIGGNTPKSVAEMRDLVAPGAVIFRKTMEEDERRCIFGAGIDTVQMHPVRKRDPGLLHGGYSPSSMRSI